MSKDKGIKQKKENTGKDEKTTTLLDILFGFLELFR